MSAKKTESISPRFFAQFFFSCRRSFQGFTSSTFKDGGSSEEAELAQQQQQQQQQQSVAGARRRSSLTETSESFCANLTYERGIGLN